MKKYSLILVLVVVSFLMFTCISNAQEYSNVSCENSGYVNNYDYGTYYNPNVYAPPFWPGFPFIKWYAQPGYIIFIGPDGKHNRHSYGGVYCGNGYSSYDYGTRYDPNVYAPPFWPRYAFSRWYARPGYVYFIGHDGQHHRYHYDRWQHPPQNRPQHWQQQWRQQQVQQRPQQQRLQQQRMQQQRLQQQRMQQQQRLQQQRQQQVRPQQQVQQRPQQQQVRPQQQQRSQQQVKQRPQQQQVRPQQQVRSQQQGKKPNNQQ